MKQFIVMAIFAITTLGLTSNAQAHSYYGPGYGYKPYPYKYYGYKYYGSPYYKYPPKYKYYKPHRYRKYRKPDVSIGPRWDPHHGWVYY